MVKRLGGEGISGTLGRAFEQFGRMRDLDKAGFIAPDGEFLDLSSFQLRRGGVTFTQHEQVTDALGFGRGIEGLLKFQKETGAVRYVPERNGISASFIPTAKQVEPVVKQARKNRQPLELDYDDPVRGITDSVELRDPTVDQVIDFYRRAAAKK